MPQRFVSGDLTEGVERALAEGAARACQPNLADRASIFAVEALENGAVFTVDGQDGRAVVTRKREQVFAGDD